MPAKSAEGGASQADVKTVLRLTFKARKGERRLVAAEVRAYQPKDTPDPLLMAATSLQCTPTAERVQGSGATTNLLRGKTSTLSTAFVYVVPKTGTITCVVRAYGSRPRPASGNGDNRWYVWHGSRLYLGTAQPHWAASARKSVRSRLITKGQVTTAVFRYAPGSAGKNRVLLLTDHKLTVCSTTRGSRDSTTNGRQLCQGHVRKSGSKVRLIVRVQQGKGEACRSRSVINQVYGIGASTHHRNIRGTIRLPPPSSKCRGALTVTTKLVNLQGTPVVVHTTFGRTSISAG